MDCWREVYEDAHSAAKQAERRALTLTCECGATYRAGGTRGPIPKACLACREMAKGGAGFRQRAAAAREKRAAASPVCITPGCGVPLTVGRGGRLPSYCADCIAARRRAANKTPSPVAAE